MVAVMGPSSSSSWSVGRKATRSKSKTRFDIDTQSLTQKYGELLTPKIRRTACLISHDMSECVWWCCRCCCCSYINIRNFKNKVRYWHPEFDTKIRWTIDSQNLQGTAFESPQRPTDIAPESWQKNITFTCVRAIPGVCYAGKSVILKTNHHFYLHTRHLRSILTACYAGKSYVFFENCTFTCITDTWYGSYAGKIDVFFWECHFCQVKPLETDKNQPRGSPGQSNRRKKLKKNTGRVPKAVNVNFPHPFFTKNEILRPPRWSPKSYKNQ